MLLTPSLVRLVLASMCLELYLLIWNRLSLMKLGLELTDNFFILTNLFLARKMLLTILLGDIILVFINFYCNVNYAAYFIGL